MFMHRLLSAMAATIILFIFACWLISVYSPLTPIQNPPGVISRFDGAHAMQFLDALTHRFKGRIVGSSQGFASADYVSQQFKAFGLKVESQDFCEAGVIGPGFTWGWVNGRNVIGILPGRHSGAVVLTAHRDCVPAAPEGAYDNGSGTAAVMELARALAASRPHRYTYVFVAIDGEEVGLAGARVLMNTRPSALDDIRLMINLDMVGFRGTTQFAAMHTQYLSPETRALVSTRFRIPPFSPLQLPLSRGTDAQLFAMRGLPTLDVMDIRPAHSTVANHGAGDTSAQVSVESMQQVGRTVEQLLLQGDRLGSFTAAGGLIPSSFSGVLAPWRYQLSGWCFLGLFLIPLLCRFRSVRFWDVRTKSLLVLVLTAGILTALSTRWSGGIQFVILPPIAAILLLVLQAVALYRAKAEELFVGRLLMASAPALLFAGTWGLTGAWAIGLAMAALAYLPAVLITWKPGWGWRLLDIVLLTPCLLVTLLFALTAWILAPLHLFPAAKLSVFIALYMAVALVCIWAALGRRLRHEADPVIQEAPVSPGLKEVVRVE